MIYTHAIASAVALAIGLAGGWQTRAWKASADRTEQLELDARDAMRRAERVDGAAAGYEGKRAAGQVRTRIIVKEVDRVVLQPFYSPGAPACLDPDGLRAVAAAVAGTDPAGQPAPALPAASGAR